MHSDLPHSRRQADRSVREATAWLIHVTSTWRDKWQLLRVDGNVLLDLPVVCGTTERGLADDINAVHQPFIQRAGGRISKENVRFPITVVVSGFDDNPVRRRREGSALADNATAVQNPFVDGTGSCVAPQNVRLSVAVEIARACDLPLQRGAADQGL